MASKSLRGQTLVSFCLCLPLMLAGTGAFAWFLFKQFATAWLDLETYALARAHLYGNALNTCHGGELEKLNRGSFQTRYECSDDGTVSGNVTWGDFHVANSRWNLARGHFERN